jgi:hypothetical protein
MSDMDIDLRTFLRNFALYKARVSNGETLRIISRDGVFNFTKESSAPQNIVGCCQGLGKPPKSIPKPLEDPDAWEMNKLGDDK